MFQSLIGSLLNHLYQYANENVSVKPLSLIYITSITRSIIVQFIEDLTVITALNHSGSFGKNSVKFKGKNENVIHQPKTVRVGNNCVLCREYRPWPTTSGGTQDLRHSFSQYGPPGWRVTRMFFFLAFLFNNPSESHD